MVQTKVSLSEPDAAFLRRHAALGFPDRSSMVRAGLEMLRQQRQEERLRQSAELYAEVYEQDADLQRLTESANDAWPA
jgi:Arc/MetJ-type ribon-helix-helix transcriptional regulator